MTGMVIPMKGYGGHWWRARSRRFVDWGVAHGAAKSKAARHQPLQKAVDARELELCLPVALHQGLVKSEGKARYGEQFRMWQQRAAEFEIDGRAPVRCGPAALRRNPPEKVASPPRGPLRKA